ncbi:MAG TPA: hypothetical protein EYG75_06935 [Campylobacterales bacterium]|nr:hypothetical protein [Campylobacterales bacterium]
MQTKNILEKQLKANKTKQRVVIVGGGFGGLNTASAIKQNDPKDEIEVIVLEKTNLLCLCDEQYTT